MEPFTPAETIEVVRLEEEQRRFLSPLQGWSPMMALLQRKWLVELNSAFSLTQMVRQKSNNS